MELPIYQVDAFTSKTFGGNPAAVVPLDEWLPDETMQKIAIENNLSETAFFVPDGDGFHLRWFTPTTEVDLCGHATLATSWVLLNELGYEKDEILFSSLSGPLSVTCKNNKITLDFPVWSSEEYPVDQEPIIEQAFGQAAIGLYKGKKWVVIFDDDKFIKNLEPNIQIINTIDSQGVVITAQSNDPNLDFVSRYFGPQVGIDEDPVTGSAHCLLTPIWAKLLDKTTFKAHQVSERGGDLDLELKNDRVFISGEASLYMKGKIYV